MILIRATAQDAVNPYSFTFETYLKSDGLNQSSTNAIYQDNEDMLWIANFGGANTFDGYQFKSYINEFGDSTTISDDVVWTFEEDDSNNLWLGTKNGLNLFHRKTQTFSTFSPVDKSTILSVKAIKSIGNNQLLVGTEGEGLFIFNTNDHEFSPFSEITNSKITSIAESSTSFWVGTENDGLFEIDKANHSTINHLQSGNLDPIFIQALHVDDENTLWVGTDNDGLYLKEVDSENFKHALDVFENHKMGNRIQTITSDDKLRIWIGSATEGLTLYDKREKKCYHIKYQVGSSRSIADNNISSICIGANNVVYIGYFQKGFDKVVETPFRIIESIPTDPNSLSHNNVYSLLHDSKGRFWVGTYGGGLNLQSSTDTKKFKHFKHDPTDPTSISHDWIRYIFEDSKNQIWIGAWGGGLNRFIEESKTFKRYLHDSKNPSSLGMNTVESIFEDSKGNIWIATYGEGINIYQPETDDFKHIRHQPDNPNSLSDDHITAFFEDELRNIWISTYGGGLNKYNPTTEDFTHFIPNPNNPKSLNDFKVLFIYDEPAEDFFWLTTLGGGLNKVYPEKSEFVHFTTNDGLPNNTTIGMLKATDGSYWISTNNGLSHFFPDEERFVNYSSADGLGSDDFNLAGFSEDSLGFFYFGGKQGITYFHPDEVELSQLFPQLAVTSINVNNRAIDISEFIEINFKDRLNIQFAAINPTSVKKIQYAYQFDGDTSWFPMGARTLELVSLDPGSHSFKIRSTNSDGIWNPEPFIFSVYVVPPWYKTTAFKVIAFVSLIGAMIGYGRFRSRKLYKQQKILKKLVDERTQIIEQKSHDLQKAYDKQKELEHFKESMVSMIAHDLKNPLVSIIRRADGDKDDDIKQIDRSGRHMLNLIENMLDVLRFEKSKMKLDITDFEISETINEVIDELKPVAEERNIQIMNKMNREYRVQADQQLIHRVLNNLVSNAIKYSHFNSPVEIQVSESVAGVKISVKDYGDGIPTQDLKKIFEQFEQSEARSFGGASSTGLGLSFCKLAIHAHGQKMEVDSTKGQGSVFSFILPIVSKGASLKSDQLSDQTFFNFKDEDYLVWEGVAEKINELEVYEAGKWSELVDSLLEKSSGTKPICDQLMKLVTEYDQNGIAAFKQKLAEFLATTSAHESN